MLRLDGKTAIVTGGGSGIGKGIAEVFAEQGAHVAIVEINADIAATTVAEIKAAGGSASARICDITDQKAVKTQVDESLLIAGESIFW